MIKEFVEKYVKLVVKQPDKVLIVQDDQDNSFKNITIFVHSDDIGLIIGKNANMIKSINAFIGVCFVKHKITYKAYVKDIEEANL